MISPSTTIYVMNMADRSDRRDHMKSLLHEFHNVKFIVPEAASKSTRDNLVRAGHLRMNDAQPFAINSHVATYLSILSSAPESEFIVMEDDIRLIEDGSVLSQMKELYKKAPSNYGALYYEYCHEYCGHNKSSLSKLKSPLCAGAIMWKRDAARRFVAWSKNKVGAVDWWLMDAVSKGVFTAYSSDPPVFYQDDGFGTDLQGGAHTMFRQWQDQKKRHCLQHTASRMAMAWLFGIGAVGATAYAVKKVYDAQK